MANSTNLEDPVEGTELNSTEAVEDALLEESALENSDSLLSVLTILNQNMDQMAGSLSAMGKAVTPLSKQLVVNMAALSDVNHMGTISSEKRNDLAKEIWSWCVQRNI